MLRNLIAGSRLTRYCLLNEVLSLNAQELSFCGADDAFAFLLNEVLSLNAQEF